MNSSRFGKPGVAWLLLSASAVLNVVLLIGRFSGGPATPVKAAVALKAAPAVAAAPVAAAVGEVAASEWKAVHASLKRSPSYTFDEVVPEDGDALSAVYSRLFMWDLDLRKDLSPGDQMAVAYRWTDEEQLEIAVARLQSKKLGKQFRAYRWLAAGDTFASYWDESGVEVPFTLKNGPLKGYEQITSLLKDRPTHKGMDFKTPVGTPVHSPQAGVVLRSNWNWNSNGNCLELQYPDGTLVKYLHLSENKVKPGDKVEADQVIALTGNTGHSTAPHLHYQINQGDKVLDPLDYHGTERRTMSDAAKVAFDAGRGRLDALLAARTAAVAE